jgi:hypothetical protein
MSRPFIVVAVVGSRCSVQTVFNMGVAQIVTNIDRVHPRWRRRARKIQED